jgi:hypothetical protein
VATREQEKTNDKGQKKMTNLVTEFKVMSSFALVDYSHKVN